MQKTLAIIGLNHKTANVEIREKVYFSKSDLPSILPKISNILNINGCIILSTCNRTEIYTSIDNTKNQKETLDLILKEWCKEKNLKTVDVEPFLYRKYDEEVVSHLFKVSCSIDSLVIGENQIIGQIKNAYHESQKANSINAILDNLFRSAIHTARTVFSKTAIGEGSASIGSAATDLIKKLFDKNLSIKIVLIGAGKISHITAQNILNKRKAKLYIINRNIQKAKAVAKDINGVAISFSDMYETILKSDAIIVSTSAPDFIIKKEDINQKGKENNVNRDKQKVFIDLSVPRNIDPTLSELENISLFSIDDLIGIVQNNNSLRLKEINKVTELIQIEENKFLLWFHKHFLLKEINEIKDNLENHIFGNSEKKLALSILEWLDSLTKNLYSLKNFQSLKDISYIIEKLKKTINNQLSLKKEHSVTL